MGRSLHAAVVAAAFASGSFVLLAQAAPPTSSNEEIGSLLTSPTFLDRVQATAQYNKTVVNGVGAGEMARARAALPSVDQVVEGVQFGPHNVISKDGEKILVLMRHAVSALAKDRAESMAQLQDLAAKGNPEALTFFGFAAEHGVAGVRRDQAKARQYYQTASTQGYQAAAYNLALMSVYGRGAPQDLGAAASLLARVSATGPDSSGRVCGMTSFVNLRLRGQAEAARYAKGCTSPLSVPARLEGLRSADERVTALRAYIATGVEDGYGLLEQSLRPFASKDTQFLYCKYALVNRYHRASDFSQLESDATRCVTQVGAVASQGLNDFSRDQAIKAVSAFVRTEIPQLEALKKANHFHFGWSVPYLPFPQAEVDIFAPAIKDRT